MNFNKINWGKIIKLIRFFTIEIVYTIVMLAFLSWVDKSFGTHTLFDEPIYQSIKYILVLLIWAIGPMLNRYLVFVATFIYSAYFISQNVYFTTFGQYYRLNTAISLTEELSGVKDSALEMMMPEHWQPFIILTIITIVFILIYYFLQRKCIKFYWTFIYKIIVVVLLINPIQAGYTTHMEAILKTKDQHDVFQLNKTDYYIYDVMPNVNQFVDMFGLYSYFIKDYKSLDNTKSFSQEDFDAVDKFLSNKKAPTKNDFTGIFEGKHVIFIQAESHIDATVSEEFTPTLYKLKTQGINFENFNTPLLVGSTSDTEFMAMTSLIPRGDGYAVSYKFPYNEYPITLPKLFRNVGYGADVYHNNYGEYYNRDELFKNFEFQEFYDSTRFGYQDHVSDSNIMEKIQWIPIEWTLEAPKITYWITYSGHQPYTLDEVGVDPKDVEKIKAKYPELEEGYVSYIAKTMDLDKSLRDMMAILEQQNKLDDFVFVYFGDHIVKGLDFSSESNYYKQTGLEPKPTDITTAMYIYNSATEPHTIKKHSTVLDMIPTICNLFNIEYDYKKTLGRDILDPGYNGFTFSDWGTWETNNYIYNYNDDKITTYNGYDEALAREEINYYKEMDRISRLILYLDYFNEEEE